MALQKTPFTAPVVTTTSDAQIYLQGAGKFHLKGIVLVNTSGVALTVTLNLVKNIAGAAGTSATANRLFNLVSLEAAETFMFEFPYTCTLETGDSVRALSSTAGVNVFVFGDLDS